MAGRLAPPAKQLQATSRRLPLGVLIVLLAAALGAIAARGGDSTPANACSSSLLRSLHDAQRQLDSLRPDKSGQTRVFAPDGSEFTTGQAQWMKAELRNVEQACAAGDAMGASEHLSNVQNLLQSHAYK